MVPWQETSELGSALVCDVDVLRWDMQVSLVDQRPEELVAAAILGVNVQYAAGLGPMGNCSSLRFSVDSVQIDDQMPGTRCVKTFLQMVQPFRITPCLSPSSCTIRRKDVNATNAVVLQVPCGAVPTGWGGWSGRECWRCRAAPRPDHNCTTDRGTPRPDILPLLVLPGRTHPAGVL